MISVIIPTYNRYDRLRTSIHSVLSQTYQNFEILLIDGSNNNRVFKLLEDFNDTRIKYIKNYNHTGVSSSRYLGVLKSSNNFIAFLDDDDTWEKNKLQLQYQKIQSSPNIDMVLCNYTINNVISKRTTNVSLEKYEKNFTQNILYSPGPFYQCILIKKKLLLDNSLFDGKATPSEDWDFFISLSKKNLCVKNICKSLFTWNLSFDSQSANLINESQSVNYIINKHKNYILKNTSAENLSILYRNSAHLFIKGNNYALAKTNYWYALLNNKFCIKNMIFYLLSHFFGCYLIKKYLFHK